MHRSLHVWALGPFSLGSEEPSGPPPQTGENVRDVSSVLREAEFLCGPSLDEIQIFLDLTGQDEY